MFMLYRLTACGIDDLLTSSRVIHVEVHDHCINNTQCHKSVVHENSMGHCSHQCHPGCLTLT